MGGWRGRGEEAEDTGEWRMGGWVGELPEGLRACVAGKVILPRGTRASRARALVVCRACGCSLRPGGGLPPLLFCCI